MAEPFRYYLRVRYHECDAQRVVFNGHYGTYIDIAFTELLNQLLPGRHLGAGGGLEFQLVRQLIEWKGPARFDDVIEISARCEHVGTTSFAMRFEMRLAGKDGAIAAMPVVTAETVNVVMDGTNWTKMAIGPELRTLLERGAASVVVDHAGFGA